MSRADASLDARRTGSVPHAVQPITEEAFHRALSRQQPVRHTNDMAGETFLTGAAIFVRVNHLHFRIEEAGDLTHTDALRLISSPMAFDRAEVGR